MKAFIAFFLIILFSVMMLLPSITSPASLSVPLDDWKYEAIERIVLAWGIKYPINSKPMSRLEMAIIIKDILEIKNNQKKERNEYLEKILKRLIRELGNEIKALECNEDVKDKQLFTSMILEAAYGDGNIMRENNFGDMMDGGWHARVIPAFGFNTGIFAMDIAPRIWLDSNKDINEEEVDFLRAYIKLESDKISLEVGKDSLWWGPGRRGSWIMTNNAQPFELIRLYNSRPYSVFLLGDLKFNVIYGRTSEQEIKYKYEGTDITKFEKPHFGGIRLNFAQSRYLEFGASLTALFTGRDGLTADDIKEVFFPRHKAVDREETEGPVTDRIASWDLAINIPSPFYNIGGIRLYMEYGGTDLSFVDRIYPRLTDVATIYGFYLDTGATDIRLEYAQNLEHNDTVWYTHGQFTDGYTHKGDIIGHYIGGAARNISVKLTHPFGEEWRMSFDYEYCIIKGRGVRSISDRRNQITIGVDNFINIKQIKIEYKYEYRESEGISTNNHLFLLRWKWN